jgi:hypothetical protein
MARRRKNVEYEPPISDAELALRMKTSAGRKLEERLQSVGWNADRPPSDGELKADEA